MLEYIAAIQSKLVTQYGFAARADAPEIPAHVPDGVYPMVISGKEVRIEIRGGYIVILDND